MDAKKVIYAIVKMGDELDIGLSNINLNRMLFILDMLNLKFKGERLLQGDYIYETYGPVIPEIFTLNSSNGALSLKPEWISKDFTLSPKDSDHLKKLDETIRFLLQYIRDNKLIFNEIAYYHTNELSEVLGVNIKNGKRIPDIVLKRYVETFDTDQRLQDILKGLTEKAQIHSKKSISDDEIKDIKNLAKKEKIPLKTLERT